MNKNDFYRYGKSIGLWRDSERVKLEREEAHQKHLDMLAENEKQAELRWQQAQQEQTEENWVPVSGSFPRLVFETKNRMDDTNAPDMQHGKQDRKTIESYGLMQPFKQVEYTSPRDGMTQFGEDPFSLPASEHFKRMRSLSDDVLLGLGFSMVGATSGLFSKMVDKFERNEGGYFMSPYLDDAMQNHETTTAFHKALLTCLSENIKDGNLDKNIVNITSDYMQLDEGAPLPQFQTREADDLLFSKDLFNGTVLTVHGIWAMQVYAENLEFKGDLVRGVFKYKVQDHFGLDWRDINHSSEDSPLKFFEWLDSFRSWYLLQHYKEYGYRPFISEMRFKL